jgi:membrane protein implicated in regulation of membrane protease activity
VWSCRGADAPEATQVRVVGVAGNDLIVEP